MATDKLRVKIEGDSRSYTKAIDRARKSTKGFQKSTVAANRTTKKQGQTFTQLSYALDDAQYGFRGVQNNLQQIAVQAGIGGPIVLGITAMLIGIQQLITHWDEFGDVASKALSAINKEIAGSQGTVASTLLYAKVLETSTKGTDEYRFALNKLKKLGFDPVNGSIEKFIKLQKQKAIATAFDKIASEKIAGFLEKIIKAQEDLEEAEERFGKTGQAGQAVQGASPLNPGQFGTRDAAFVNVASAKSNLSKIEGEMETFTAKIASTIKKYFPTGIFDEIIGDDGVGSRDKLKSVLGFGLIDSTIEQGKEWQKYAKKIVESFADAWNIAADGAELKVPGVDAIDAGIKATQAKLGHNITETADKAIELGQALQSSITSAFVGLGDAIGSILANEGDFGDKFLGLVGSFMKTFGAAIIGIGVAALELEKGLSTGQAWLAIGAGIALVAAGAALSNAAAKGIDGQGGSSNYGGGGSAASSPAPQIIQGSNGNNFSIGEVRFRGQDMIVQLEAGNRIRSNKT